MPLPKNTIFTCYHCYIVLLTLRLWNFMLWELNESPELKGSDA